jgi:hypothetical protein
MYEGVLAFLGLHGKQSDGEVRFAAPPSRNAVRPVWTALTKAMLSATTPITVDELYRFVMAPPYGVKSGVVPLLLLSALQVHRDELAVFDDGTYQPYVTDTLMELIVKAPERFAVVATSSTQGPRAELLDAFAATLGIDATAPTRSGRKPSTLLKVVNALLSEMRELDGYTRRTRRLPEHVVAVRTALLEARDPAELLFTALPQALGEAPFAGRKTADRRRGKAVAEGVVAALGQLTSARPSLEKEVAAILCAAFAAPAGLAGLRSTLREKTAVLHGVSLEPGLAGLVQHSLNALPDEDWLEPLVLLVSGRPFGMWDDDDLGKVTARAQALAATLESARVLHRGGADHQSRLVSLTASDGSQRSVLMEKAPDPDLLPILEMALTKARKKHGDAAATELLGLLIEQVMPPTARNHT